MKIHPQGYLAMLQYMWYNEVFILIILKYIVLVVLLLCLSAL